jgi:hypothetical protein
VLLSHGFGASRVGVVGLAVHAISIGYGAPNASPLTRFLGRFVRPISVITQ